MLRRNNNVKNRDKEFSESYEFISLCGMGYSVWQDLSSLRLFGFRE